MAPLTLRGASRQVGLHRSNLYRAIKSGRLSATRADEGGCAIDPAELFRVYPPQKPSAERARQPATVCVEHDATGPATLDATAEMDATALRVRIAALEGELRARTVEVAGLRELADSLKSERDSLKGDRDRWAAQAERLALSRPRAHDRGGRGGDRRDAARAAEPAKMRSGRGLVTSPAA